ncbi:YhcH/YjgK/YiaL family protein [Martelella mediterranea]|uniref:Biofilm protein TabA n=1 Tax=Martelella mediterranea TaxID=293089 RepID=A0A4R3NHX8_9HYPH|nr:YhcH/YjgK/YiaL family protein [Martelella mediterranea]TCT31725.1 biofilm protein TabA [Martelella mediterranea]
MITGHLDCLQRAGNEFPDAVFSVLDALAVMDFHDIEDGEIALAGHGLTARLFSLQTHPREAGKAESHLENIDIHLVVSGAEKIVQAPLTDAVDATRQGQHENDNLFYDLPAEPVTAVTLKPGDFAVLFPWDLHAPGCSVPGEDSVRKVVVKLPLASLKAG